MPLVMALLKSTDVETQIQGAKLVTNLAISGALCLPTITSNLHIYVTHTHTHDDVLSCVWVYPLFSFTLSLSASEPILFPKHGACYTTLHSDGSALSGRVRKDMYESGSVNVLKGLAGSASRELREQVNMALSNLAFPCMPYVTSVTGLTSFFFFSLVLSLSVRSCVPGTGVITYSSQTRRTMTKR